MNEIVTIDTRVSGSFAKKPITFDPYGPIARALLAKVRGDVEEVADEFAHTFYETLALEEGPAQILGALTDEEFASLKRAQAKHFRWLLHPDTVASSIIERAQEVGRIHALSGVTPAWMGKAMQLYEDHLHQHLELMRATAPIRYRLLRAASARLRLDVSQQLHALEEAFDAYTAHLARPLATAANWNDGVQAELDALAALPGIKAALVLRPNTRGMFISEASAGELAEPLRSVVQSGKRPSVSARSGVHRGLLSEAWFSGQIQQVACFSEDQRTSTFHETLPPLGVRSAVAIPIDSGVGSGCVLTLLGAFPFQFSSRWMMALTGALRGRWSQFAVRGRGRATPIAEIRSENYRELVYGGGFRIHLQPVADLRTGAVIKAEALGRLVTPDGQTVMPGKFLPSLGTTELSAVFRMGLEQSLDTVRAWRREGLNDIGIAVNLPPSVVVDPDCTKWVDQALKHSGVRPELLTLELLESEAFDQQERALAIHRLAGLGVKIAMDDLGSGYSGLTRLASLPFNVIKIDQGLVRHSANDPIKSFGLIHSMIQFGHDVGCDVVVEGLENEALIEVATWLGAKHGQGYGIARPMPPEDFPGWLRRDHQGLACGSRINTAAGALAFHLGVNCGRRSHHKMPLHSCALNDFFSQEGQAHGDVVRWHQKVHEGTDQAHLDEANRRLKAHLAHMVHTSMARVPS